MSETFVPLGGHFFSQAALQQYADDAAKDLAPGKHGVLKAGVDVFGAKVVLVVTAKDGVLKVETAFAHDWTGANRFGASGSVSF